MYTIWNIGRKFYQESSFASWGRSPRDEGRCFFQATISVRCLLAGILVLVVSVCIGQTDTVATMQPVVDSVADSPYKIFANEIRKGYRKSLNDYLLSKDQHHRDSVVEQMVLCTYEAKEYLRQAPDTVAIKKEIEKIRNWLELADIGVFKDTATAQTYRNLTTTSVLMGEMLQRISVYKEDLWNYRRKLASFKLRYDSLNADSALYNFSEDSATLIREIIKLSSVAVEVQPIDSMLKSTLIQLDEVGSPLYLLESVLKLRLDQIEDYQESLSQNLFHKEFSTIWAKVRNRKPIQEILSFSAAKNWLALRFYVWDHRGKVIFLLLLIVLATYFIRSLKSDVIAAGQLKPEEEGQLVLRHPFISAVFIVLNVFQFIFLDPPFLLSAIIWVIAAISLTFIFWKFITRYWMLLWVMMLVLFILACGANLTLQVSQPERVGILFLSILGFGLGGYYLVAGRTSELRERFIVYFIRIVIVLELLSAIANIYGRYNFSKSMLIAGYANVIIGILFLWTIRLINEGLMLGSKMYQRPDKKLLHINFERIGSKVPWLFYVALVVGWIILVGRNFYAYKQVITPLRSFLFEPRTVGNYTFSIEAVFVFFAVVALALLLSKLVSYFAADDHHTESLTTEQGKVGLGSWLLLVRIFIICMGLFVAFAAAGIPMDRITIIIGALGVGIGLGLQALVNNLVSGLIIAFEKPLNVGDLVEVAGKTGLMKSIGFRSSVLMLLDGSQAVIPNGDLLNEHLINWTRGQGHRRVELLFEISYQSDLEKVKPLILDIILGNERVMRQPEPAVLVKDFESSGIGLRCLFWVYNVREWFVAKSEIMIKVHAAFKEHGIEIPFPQRDLHIKNWEFLHEKPLASGKQDIEENRGDQAAS